MPVCRLLRVHSTGSAPRGSSAHPGRNPSADSVYARCRFGERGEVHRTQPGVGTQRRERSGVFGKREQPAGDRVAGGLGAGAEQQVEEQVALDVRQYGVLGIDHQRPHVVAGPCPFGQDQFLPVGVHPRAGLLDREPGDGRRARAAEVEAGLDRLEQPMPFGFRHSQQDADHLHRHLGGHIGDEVERLAGRDLVEQAPRPGTQVVLDAMDHPRRQTRADQPAHGGVPRIVHHIQQLPGDGQVLQQGAAERPATAGHRRVGLRITEHRKGFRMCGDRPEALAVGGVFGGLVPVHRRAAAVHGEQLVRESPGEVVQIGEVDLGQLHRGGHRIAPEVYLAASG